MQHFIRISKYLYQSFFGMDISQNMIYKMLIMRKYIIKFCHMLLIRCASFPSIFGIFIFKLLKHRIVPMLICKKHYLIVHILYFSINCSIGRPAMRCFPRFWGYFYVSFYGKAMLQTSYVRYLL